MKMYKLTERKPEVDREILAYITHCYNYQTSKVEPLKCPMFYVVVRTGDKKEVSIYNDDMEIIGTKSYETYVEAAGEGYSCWKECEIEGWCYTDEIEVEYAKED